MTISLERVYLKKIDEHKSKINSDQLISCWSFFGQFLAVFWYRGKVVMML